MYLARAILGFAGESTPFGTVESLQRLFPNQFLLMAGALHAPLVVPHMSVAGGMHASPFQWAKPPRKGHDAHMQK